MRGGIDAHCQTEDGQCVEPSPIVNGSVFAVPAVDVLYGQASALSPPEESFDILEIQLDPGWPSVIALT